MLYSFCIGLILVASVMLILAVLVQSPKSGMAANFGAAWRNYWGMDSVGGGWYSDHNRSILERLGSGDYDVHGQVSFTYDGQTILIPLDGWAYSDRTCALSWNF